MRFLMICMQFPTGEGESYMTTELADALVEAGHEVEVLQLDWSAPPGRPAEEIRTATGIHVVRCAPSFVRGFGPLVRNASKFILSGRRAARLLRRHFDLSTFDAAIAWMPAIAIAPVIKAIERAGIPHRLLFIWDFFPDHHYEIGRIPGGLVLRIARAWEQRLLAVFTAIICTLPGNTEYLRRKFSVRADQRVLARPLWGSTEPVPVRDRALVRAKHSLPLDARIAVFGGQLVEGRGFEQMLTAADDALMRHSDLLFLFVGDGRLAPLIRDRAGEQANLAYRPGLNHADFLELLTSCDVGMAATVPGVTSFSTPTKIIDYLRAGLPTVLAVEHGNDLVVILEGYGVGSAVQFGDHHRFSAKADQLARGGKIDAAARRCLEEVFDVRHAVATVMEAVGPDAQGRFA